MIVIGKMKPNLFIIGAPKSGTSTLAYYLGQHPEILVSTPKETCFHILKYDLGINYYIKSYFKGYKNQSIICDASIMNLYFSEITAPRIFNDFPAAKLLVILRDPIERAYSDCREAVVRGLETLRFEKTLDVENERLSKDFWPLHERIYFRRGLYFKQLTTYLKYFPQEKIKILIYEEFYRNIYEGLREIFKFIGVDIDSNVNVTKSLGVNRMSVKNIYLQRFFRGDHRLGAYIKKVIPNKFGENVLRLRHRIMKHNLRNSDNKKINARFREVLREYYKESNKNLERQLNLNLSSWDY